MSANSGDDAPAAESASSRAPRVLTGRAVRWISAGLAIAGVLGVGLAGLWHGDSAVSDDAVHASLLSAAVPSTRALGTTAAQREATRSPASGATVVPGTREEPGTPVVFFVPHQDDEVLSMGAAILEAQRQGRPVWVVLVTTGSTSNARRILCRKRNVCLTPERFSQARTQEFLMATHALGIPRQRVAVEGLSEADSRVEGLLTMMRRYARTWGNAASYRTMSWLDAQVNHFSLGYALNQLCLSGEVRHCLFYQSDLYRTDSTLQRSPAGHIGTPPARVVPLTEEDQERWKRAANAYRLWLPQQGRYAVGWTYSVPAYFEYALEHPDDLEHGPSSTWGAVASAQAGWGWAQRSQHRRPHDASRAFTWPPAPTTPALSLGSAWGAATHSRVVRSP